MDPDVTLKALRELIEEVLEDASYEDTAHRGIGLAELFMELDGWLTKGGFKPTDWKKA